MRKEQHCGADGDVVVGGEQHVLVSTAGCVDHGARYGGVWAGLVPLTAATSDPDYDIVATRWLVDGVLLEEMTTKIAFTQAHEIKVFVTDSRGAVTSESKVVSCAS